MTEDVFIHFGCYAAAFPDVVKNDGTCGLEFGSHAQQKVAQWNVWLDELSPNNEQRIVSMATRNMFNMLD